MSKSHIQVGVEAAKHLGWSESRIFRILHVWFDKYERTRWERAVDQAVFRIRGII